jgi:hypothetical protein
MIALTFGYITYDENKAPITPDAKLILRKSSFFLVEVSLRAQNAI